MTDSATLATPEADDEETGEDLGDLLLEVLPGDGTTIGSLPAREALSRNRVDKVHPIKYYKEARRNR